MTNTRLIDAYDNAGFATCVRVSIGLLIDLLIAELAWTTIICTTMGSIIYQIKDFQTHSFKVMKPNNIED